MSIIGPNGSGKSNLMESLLFIFGHRASRMRLKQLKELIHNSANHYNIPKATVRVTFHEIEEKKDGTERVIDRVTISRNVYAESSHSNYEFNGMAASREDIVSFLKSKGMDMNNNRFLILQGEVEQISLMKPSTKNYDDPGLLEYLEDIIGSNVLIPKLKEIEISFMEAKKLKEEHMLFMNDLRLELEAMKGHKERGMRYVDAKRNSMTIRNIILNLRIHELLDLIELKDEILEKLKLEEKAVEFQTKTLLKEESGFLKDFKALSASIEETTERNAKINQVIQSLQKADGNKRSAHKLLLEEVHDFRKLISDGLKEIAQLEENKEMEMDISKMEEDVARFTKEMEYYKEQVAGQMEQVSGDLARLTVKEQELNASLAPIEKRHKNLVGERDSMDVVLQKINEKARKLSERNEKLEIDLRDQEAIVRGLKGNQIEYSMELDDENKEFLQLSAKYQELSEKKEELSKEVKTALSKLQERERYNDKIQTKNAVLAFLNDESSRTIQTGKIYGRIGDLASIDSKYDIAICAISTKFNSILVDNSDTGVKCVKMLKEERIGYADFMCLNKIQGESDRINAPFIAPPKSMRLFDLIKTNREEVKLAYSNILQDTLVCEDLDYGERLAMGKVNGRNYRVVTLQGHIIYQDGRMSGGGKPRQGMVNLSASKVPLTMNVEDSNEHLKIEHRQLSEKLNFVTEQLKSVKSKRDKHSWNVTESEDKLRKVEELLASQERNMDELRERKKTLAKEAEVYQSKHVQRDSLMEDIVHLNTQIKKIEEDRRELLQGVEALRRQRYDTEGPQVRAHREKIEELSAAVQRKEGEIESYRIECESSNMEIERRRRDIKEWEEKVAAAGERIEVIKQEQVALEEKMYKVIEEKDLLEEQSAHDVEVYEQMKVKLGLVKEANSKFKAALSDIEKRRKKAKEERDVFTSELKACEERVVANKEKYLKFIDEFSFMDELPDLENRSQEKELRQRAEKYTRGNDHELKAITPESKLTWEDLQSLGMTMDQAKESLAKYQREKKASEMETDIMILYVDKLREYRKRYTEYCRLEGLEKECKDKYMELKNKRISEFLAGFTFISKTLKQVYQTITNGGDADLELIDSYDPFAGILFTVRPPHKSWKHMSKLSGGEKTLSSLSLIFALHYYKPTPIYFMDEIDAALDFKNVEIVAKFMKERTKSAQLIVISLRNHMYELSNQLVGIYKTADTTKTIFVVPALLETKRTPEEVKEDQELKRQQQSSDGATNYFDRIKKTSNTILGKKKLFDNFKQLSSLDLII